MTEARALGWARVALGVIFLARTTPLLLPLHVPFSAELLGWPTREWSVAVTGLALPNVVIAILCVARTAGAVLFTCGVRAREAGIVAAAAGYLVVAQDRFAFINSLHILFAATFVLSLTTAPSAVALVPTRTAPVESSVRFLSLFLASIYFWAGLAKLQPEWLSGRALEVQSRAGAFAGVLGALVEREWMRNLASWSVPAAELAIAALLVARRRRAGIVLALAFHLVVELTVNPDTLGWQMAVLLLAIWPRGTPGRARPAACLTAWS